MGGWPRSAERESVTSRVNAETPDRPRWIVITVRAHRRHPRAEARMNRDCDVELFSGAPKRLVGGIVETPAVERIWAHEHGLEAEVAHDAAHLAHRFIDILQRHRRDRVQAPRIRAAEVGHPVVVGATGRGCELRVGEIAVEQPQRRVEDGDVDSLRVHHLDPLMRVAASGRNVVPGESARTLEIAQSAGDHRGRDRQRRAASILAADPEFIAAPARTPNLDDPIVEFGLGVLGPHFTRLDHVAVGIDYPIHRSCLLWRAPRDRIQRPPASDCQGEARSRRAVHNGCTRH